MRRDRFSFPHRPAGRHRPAQRRWLTARHRSTSQAPGGAPTAGRSRRLLAVLAAPLVTVPLAVVVMAASPASAAAEPADPLGPWQWANPLPQGGGLYGVHFSDPDTGTAVGRMGTILRTTDGGASWTPQPNPVTDANEDHTVNDVHFSDADTGVAVLDQSSSPRAVEAPILRTTDGGATWTIPETPGPPGTIQYFDDVSFADTQTGYAVGKKAGGHCLALRTVDGGQTWQDANLPCEPAGPDSYYYLNRVHAITPDIVVGVGDNGTIMRTDNGGDSWQVLANSQAAPLPGLGNDPLYGVFFTTPDTGWVVGSGSRIFHTSDGGDSWTPQAANTTHTNLRDVQFTSATTGWIAADNGHMLHTTNSGENWQRSEPANAPLKALSVPEPGVVVAVGLHGTIVHTDDGGASWQQLSTSATNRQLYGVSLAADGSQLAMAVGREGTILGSQDAGDTWQPLDSDIAGTNVFRDVHVIDSDTAVVVGDGGMILRTEDGGDSWQQVDWQRQDGAAGTTRLRDVTFADGNMGYITGEQGTFLRTDDGGVTWQDRSPPVGFWQDRPFPPILYSASCPDADTCIVVGGLGGGGGIIVRTDDAGLTWNTVHTTQDFFYYEDVSFANDDVGLVVGDTHTILRTVDGGDTWEAIEPEPVDQGVVVQYLGVSLADENTGTVVGKNGFVLRTEDGGLTWQPEQRRTIVDLAAVAHLDSDVAVVVGRDGVVLARGPGGGGGPQPTPEASQDLNVTVPDQPGQGSLTISVDPDDRVVNLPPVAMADTGDRLSTAADLRPVTVTDTRTQANPGWDATAQVSEFTGQTISLGGGYLGWTPQIDSHSDGQQVTAGEPVAPGFPTGDGLSVPQTLATAPADAGVGVAQLGAGLELEIPIDTPPGTYTAQLTLTAI